MQDDPTLRPYAKAVLVVPFWLPHAPSPLSVEARRFMLEEAASTLQGNKDAESPIRWEVLELNWSRELQSIQRPSIWHPKAATGRKGAILKGSFINDEDVEQLTTMCGIRITERSIIYFDYGMCSLEYVFEFTLPMHPSSDAWLTAPFWSLFREKVMNDVERRELGVLKEPHWSRLQGDLAEALALGYASAAGAYPSPLIASPALLRRTTDALLPWMRRAFRPTSKTLQWGIMPINRIFRLNRNNGHICPSFGLNFILFAEQGAAVAMSPDTPLMLSAIERILGGKPIGNSFDDRHARSDRLVAMYYGAVHTLVIVRSTPEIETAAATADAARSLLRYLWMGYAILTEASRGLIALHGEFYLGYASMALRQEGLVRSIVKDLEVATQISRLLIAEFHFTMFWESELEYDIYQPAYEVWRMSEVGRFLEDNLAAVARTAEVLRRGVEERRQRAISWLLGSIAALTVITAVADFFSFSEWKLSFLNIDYPIHEGWKDIVTIFVILAWLGLIIVMVLLSRERRDRR